MSDYYKAPNGLEVFDLINSLGLGFADGNVFKYILRAGRKPGAAASEDYKKALCYLELVLRPQLLEPPTNLVKKYCEAFEVPEDIADALVLYEYDATYLIEALQKAVNT